MLKNQKTNWENFGKLMERLTKFKKIKKTRKKWKNNENKTIKENGKIKQLEKSRLGKS